MTILNVLFQLRNKQMTISFVMLLPFFISPINELQAVPLTINYSYDKLQRVTSGNFQNGSLESTLSYTYDPLGNIIQRNISTQNSTLAGDVNNDSQVTLADAIIALKILNQSPILGSIASSSDVNNDHRIGLAETIYAMNYSAAPPVGTVVSAGRIWMDRNLGASRVATSATDAEAYGDLYQWGRGTDGHEKRTSGTTTTLSSSATPGHGNFIIRSSSPGLWTTTQMDNLWQGVNGINNPCPAGFRLPTETEWETERASWSSNDDVGAISSPLKLPLGGGRTRNDGVIRNVDNGGVWSSTTINANARVLGFHSGYAAMGTTGRADGIPVRCIKE